MLYRRKPITVEAVKLTDETFDEANLFMLESGQPWHGCYVDEKGEATKQVTENWGVLLKTPNGVVIAKKGDYVVKDVNGNLYPCSPDIFEKTHEPAIAVVPR